MATQPVFKDNDQGPVIRRKLNELGGYFRFVADGITDISSDIVASQTARNEALTFRNEAEGFRDQAMGAAAGETTVIHGNTTTITMTGTGNTASPLKANFIGLANVNNTSDANKPVSTAQLAALNNKVDKVTAHGLYPDVDKTKLSGIATGATANQTDTYLRNRTNHTGTQGIATITGLQAALDAASGGDLSGIQTQLDNKVDKLASHGLYPDADKTKLLGIATGATKNATDAALRGRATHTGTQPISSITGLQDALDAASGADLSGLQNQINSKVDKLAAHGLYPDVDKTKLLNIAAGATVNSTDVYLRNRTNHTGTQAISTITGLQDALNAASGTDLSGLQNQIDNKVDKVAAHGLYPDIDKTKLTGIATQATKNDTDANLKNRANHTGTQAIATVTGLQAALNTASEQADWNAITGNGVILNKPSMGTNALGNRTVSTVEPVGTGSAGDVWFVVES